MGDFSYICKCCGTPINDGELCVMKHIRHGKVLGEVTGHYDGYGRVTEEEGKENRFRGEEGINSHEQLCESEFSMEDSLKVCPDRIVNGKRMAFSIYSLDKQFEIMDMSHGFIAVKTEQDKKLVDFWENDKDKFYKYCYELFKNYPLAVEKPASGIAVWHKKCYDSLSEEEKNDYTPSPQDPNQGWGEARKEFI